MGPSGQGANPCGHCHGTIQQRALAACCYADAMTSRTGGFYLETASMGALLLWTAAISSKCGKQQAALLAQRICAVMCTSQVALTTIVFIHVCSVVRQRPQALWQVALLLLSVPCWERFYVIHTNLSSQLPKNTSVCILEVPDCAECKRVSAIGSSNFCAPPQLSPSKRPECLNASKD
jgi:hypothetical protein